ncbi:MAG: SAM-dependent methyltransferase [Luteibaculum sp.]
MLYLIPSFLGTESRPGVLPAEILQCIENISVVFAENPKTARKFFKQLGVQKPLSEFVYYTLDKRSSAEELREYLNILKGQKSCGIISEAGCPAIADPGSALVEMAHRAGIKVLPLVGPSSILLALMASGLNGQSFSFHGYLPIDGKELAKKLADCIPAAQQGYAQIVMETPYRNLKLFGELLNRLPDNFRLCVAANLTQESEWIKTALISEWKKSKAPEIHKIPAIMVFGI